MMTAAEKYAVMQANRRGGVNGFNWNGKDSDETMKFNAMARHETKILRLDARRYPCRSPGDRLNL